MPESIAFVPQGSQATLAAQAAFISQMETAADANVPSKRGGWDTTIASLRPLTRRWLIVAKHKFRNPSAKLEVLAQMTVEAGSRSGKLQESLEWESALEEVDAAWEVLTGVNLASFNPSVRVLIAPNFRRRCPRGQSWAGRFGD